MDFSQFADEFTKNMSEQFKNLEVRRADVDKLQGQSYHGLVLKAPEGPVGISINLDNYYRKIGKGQTMAEVLTEAYTDVLHMDLTPPFIDMETLRDYEAMKQYLILQLVPVEGNEEMLEKVPHRLFSDLAVVFRFLLPGRENGEASILVTKENLKTYEITEEQLAADAAASSREHHPMTVRNIVDVLFGEAPPEEKEENTLWVVSNDIGRYGASVVAYPDALEEIGRILGSGYYLAPSSVHEMLVIPDGTGIDGEGLDAMVRSVNATEVSEEDRLTNHSYHYDRRLQIFENAREYEMRTEAGRKPEENGTADMLHGAFPEG